jgi:DNA-binding NtrC family response regulator
MSEVKILIVEDEEFIRETVAQFLNIKGYRNIMQTSKGEDAIAIIQKERPDIVFLDIMLADDTDGMEVLKQVMEFAPLTKIVMMSAYLAEYGAKSKELGAYGFLKKPILRAETFINMIREIEKPLS